MLLLIYKTAWRPKQLYRRWIRCNDGSFIRRALYDLSGWILKVVAGLSSCHMLSTFDVNLTFLNILTFHVNLTFLNILTFHVNLTYLDILMLEAQVVYISKSDLVHLGFTHVLESNLNKYRYHVLPRQLCPHTARLCPAQQYALTFWRVA